MVRGLDKFREHFRAFPGQYVLIGGAACELLMEEAGLSFRATKDLDIVLCVEALDASFVRAFWEFVQSGKYQTQQSSTGKTRYYRFLTPENDEYPFMLELFSTKPDIVDLAEGAHLTPIPVDEEVSGLSAILLDETYYACLHSGKRTIEELSVIGPAYLIPLKARAWLDLTARKEAGATIDRRDIVKHKNDVFRLYQLLDPNFVASFPRGVREDMGAFVKAMRTESIDLRNLGIRRQSIESVLEELWRLYVQD